MSVTLRRLRAIQPAVRSDNCSRYALPPRCKASKSHEKQQPMTVTIRPYQAADWTRLCEIHDAARLDELGQTVGKDAFLTLEQTAENEGLFDNQLFVADVDQKVRGFVAYSEEELAWLYVDPPFYRKGVGRALLQHAVAQAGPHMMIEVLEGNTSALALYLSEGFTVAERVEGKLAGNESYAAVGFVLKRASP